MSFIFFKHFLCSGGGGGTPLYKLYRYVLPHRVGFLHRFGLKTGIHFAHFGLELGVVFEGTKLSSFCLRSGILSDNEVF